MSILRDFCWYYGEQWLGYETPSGEIAAFFIHEVSYDGHTDPDDIDCVEDDLSLIQFNGKCYLNGEEWYETINYDDPLLIKKLPNLGYVELNDSVYYLTYQPIRSVKKGFSLQRIKERDRYRIDTCWDFAKIFKNGYKKQTSFYIDEEGVIYYKFFQQIGNMVDGIPVILPKMSYLKNALKGFLNEHTNDDESAQEQQDSA